MVRDQSPSSESGEERHDRFRSERNQPKSGGLKLGCRLSSSEESTRRRNRDYFSRRGRSRSRSCSVDKCSRSESERHRERRHKRRRNWGEDRESRSPTGRKEYKRKESPPKVKKYEFSYSDSYHYREDRRSKSNTREIKYVIKEDVREESSQHSRKHKREKHKHKKRHKDKYDNKCRSPSSGEESIMKGSRSSSSHDMEDTRVHSKGPEVVNPSVETNFSDVPLVQEAQSQVEMLGLPPGKPLELLDEEEKNPLLMGPALPPTMREEEHQDESKVEEVLPEIFIGPVIPEGPKLSLGEVSPSQITDDGSEQSPEEGEILSEGEKPLIGPKLPQRSNIPMEGKDKRDLYGPALPPSLKEVPPTIKVDLAGDEVDLSIGPLPEGMMSAGQRALEARAALLKRQMESKEEGDNRERKREEWMLELPQGRANAIGLGPRKFRAKEGPDLSDTSLWTDTPADKLKKQELAQAGVVSENTAGKEVLEKAWIEERDNAMELLAQEGSKGKKRDLSLLEIHQKELKKKKKKEKKEKGEQKEERRPFNRETDLQVNRFDEAQKKSILKKAQLLNSRFSSGESKYL